MIKTRSIIYYKPLKTQKSTVHTDDRWVIKVTNVSTHTTNGDSARLKSQSACVARTASQHVYLEQSGWK